MQLVSGSPTQAAAEVTGEADAQAETGGGPDVYAVIAFAAAVLGIGLAHLPRPIGPALAAGLGLVGAGVLFLLKNQIDGRIPAEAREFIEVRTELGFWLALLFFLAAAGSGVYRLVTERGTAPTTAGPTGFETAPTRPVGPEPPP